MSLTLICKMTRLSFSIYDNPNNISLESKYARVNTTMKGLESTRESSNNQMLWQLSHLLHNYFLKISIPITKIKKKKRNKHISTFQADSNVPGTKPFLCLDIDHLLLPSSAGKHLHQWPPCHTSSQKIGGTYLEIVHRLFWQFPTNNLY